MKRHKFVPRGGMRENPGVWDNGSGGLVYVSECTCGVVRKKGVDYTGERPGNEWGPHFWDVNGKRIPNAGRCLRENDNDDE